MPSSDGSSKYFGAGGQCNSGRNRSTWFISYVERLNFVSLGELVCRESRRWVLPFLLEVGVSKSFRRIKLGNLSV